MSAKVTERWLLIFVIAVCAVPLLIVAFGSFHMRYMADDFCNRAAVAELGWLKFVLNTYTGWTGTFSALAFHGIMPNAEQLIFPTVLALCGWAALLYVAATAILKRATAVREHGYLFAAATAVLLLAAFVCTVPSLHESLFWYAAAAHYTFSLVLSTLYIPLILGSRKADAAPILFGFSFFLAGFTITFAALQIFFLFSFLILSKHEQTRRRLLASLLGALAGAAVLVAAPGNAVRASVANAKPDLLFIIAYLPKIMLNLLNFIIHRALVYIITTFFVFFLLSYYYGMRKSKQILTILIVVALTLGGAAAPFVPVTYVTPTYIPPRTWTASIWAIVCGIAALGYLSALAFRKQEQPLGYLPMHARIIVAILAVGFLLNSLPIALEAVSRQAAYAAAWDERDAYLRSLSGTTELARARSFHGAFAREDLTNDPNFWSNVCIARYYNLPAIVSDDQPPFVP